MIPTDLDIVRAVAASYNEPPTIQVSDVRLVLTRPADVILIAIPGTRVLADWVRDLSIGPTKSRMHPQLGECHDGCLTGAEMIVDAVKAVVGADPYLIAGHSLGGGIGALLAALLTLASCPPLRLVTFGAMRASVCDTVPKFLADLDGVSYRNGDDPVVDLPCWPYEPWKAWTQIGLSDNLLAVEDHAIDCYIEALVR